jgi:hypothetical protein
LIFRQKKGSYGWFSRKTPFFAKQLTRIWKSVPWPQVRELEGQQNGQCYDFCEHFCLNDCKTMDDLGYKCLQAKNNHYFFKGEFSKYEQ